MNVDFTTDELANLRDLKHFYGWDIYCKIANGRIAQLNKDYLHENVNQDQAWELRVRLQGIMLFQQTMEEIVNSAGVLLEQKLQQLYQEAQEAHYGGDAG